MKNSDSVSGMFHLFPYLLSSCESHPVVPLPTHFPWYVAGYGVPLLMFFLLRRCDLVGCIRCYWRNIGCLWFSCLNSPFLFFLLAGCFCRVEAPVRIGRPLGSIDICPFFSSKQSLTPSFSHSPFKIFRPQWSDQLYVFYIVRMSLRHWLSFSLLGPVPFGTAFASKPKTSEPLKISVWSNYFYSVSPLPFSFFFLSFLSIVDPLPWYLFAVQPSFASDSSSFVTLRPLPFST